MPRDKNTLQIRVLRQRCGQLPVVLGAAAARDLCRVSFADVFFEDRAAGYQRPFDAGHSRDFRSYIEQPNASTIPLTFNLRGSEGERWQIVPDGPDTALLIIHLTGTDGDRVMAQVDCQHRLGTMQDSDLPLTFQCFLGLTSTEEMAIFNTINRKAKGLSPSLLDYHTTQLPSATGVPPELFIAKHLNDDPASALHGRVKLGGAGTQGVQRRLSLRGLQVATRLLLQHSPLGAAQFSLIEKYEIVRDYWLAIARVWTDAWAQPRTHLITKGVGATALSLLAGDILTAIFSRRERATTETFAAYLSLLEGTDWSNTGPFKGYGGRQGAQHVHELLRTRLFAPGLAVARGNEGVRRV